MKTKDLLSLDSKEIVEETINSFRNDLKNYPKQYTHDLAIKILINLKKLADKKKLK